MCLPLQYCSRIEEYRHGDDRADGDFLYLYCEMNGAINPHSSVVVLLRETAV